MSHSDLKVTFECLLCATLVTFSRHDNLTLHLKRIHGIVASKVTENAIYCDLCAVTFKTKISLIKHMKLIHLKIEQIVKLPCAVCSLKFSSKELLINHLNAIHLKKFCCRNCCKILGSARTLAKHEARGKC